MLDSASKGLEFAEIAPGDDLKAIIAFAEVAHKESRFGTLPFNQEKMHRSIKQVLANKEKETVLMARSEQQIVGLAHCSIGEYFLASGTLIATIHSIVVLERYRYGFGGGLIGLKLFKGVESWSRARGATEVFLHVTTGRDLARSHKLAKRLGFRFIGGSYVKDLG